MKKIVDLKTGFLRIFFWRFIEVKRTIPYDHDHDVSLVNTSCNHEVTCMSCTVSRYSGNNSLFESFTVATMTWFTVTEYLCQKWPRKCSVCRNHNPVLSSFMTSFITGFVTRERQRMSRVDQELPPLPEHLSSPPGFQWGLCCLIFSFLCDFLLFVLFLLANVLSFFDLRLLITHLVSSNFS